MEERGGRTFQGSGPTEDQKEPLSYIHDQGNSTEKPDRGRDLTRPSERTHGVTREERRCVTGVTE